MSEGQCIHYRQIQSLDAEGLTFGDANGASRRVLFRNCLDGWRAERKSWGDLSAEGRATMDAPESRGVGQRDVTARPPYVRLYCSPPLTVEFSEPRWWQFWRGSAREAFVRFHQRIEALGWSTFDLS